jgi:hypothetical protein
LIDIVQSLGVVFGGFARFPFVVASFPLVIASFSPVIASFSPVIASEAKQSLRPFAALRVTAMSHSEPFAPCHSEERSDEESRCWGGGVNNLGLEN